MKTLYSEVLSLDHLLEGTTSVNVVNLTEQCLKLQIQGNTILHLFALNENSLKAILEYLEQNYKEYLCAILMKNDQGDTPLDISIEQDSLRTTDLMLRYLAHVKNGDYSRQLYEKFPDILKLGLKSFHR